MEQILEVLNSIGSLLTGGGLGVLTFLFFYDSRKRTEAAKAKQEEANAKAAEENNITSYAEEWKKCYEEERESRKELDAKIDRLYEEKETDRQRIRELQEKCQQYSLDLQATKFLKCEVKGCKDRQPPTGY